MAFAGCALMGRRFTNGNVGESISPTHASRLSASLAHNPLDPARCAFRSLSFPPVSYALTPCTARRHNMRQFLGLLHATVGTHPCGPHMDRPISRRDTLPRDIAHRVPLQHPSRGLMPPIHFTSPTLPNQVFGNVTRNAHTDAGRDRLAIDEKTGPYLDVLRWRAARGAEQFTDNHYAAEIVILTTAATLGTAMLARMMARAPTPSMKNPASDDVSNWASCRMTAYTWEAS